MLMVSILIPVFNRKEFIADCIQSALSQTFNDFEVIVVDNASDDGTWEICQSFAAMDSRVRVFRNSSNVGPVRNWVRCIDEARGHYIKFLFSDDLIMPEFLAETVPILSDNTVALVSTAALIGKVPAAAKVNYAGYQYKNIPSRKYLEWLALGRPSVPVSPGTALFRSSDVRKNLRLKLPIESLHDFTKNGAGPDVLLFALTANHYTSVVMLNQPLVFFREHSGSFSVANVENSVTEGYWLALAWYFKTHSTNKSWSLWVARIWLSQLRSCRTYISLMAHLKRYSGKGNFFEFLSVTAAVMYLLFNKLFRQ